MNGIERFADLLTFETVNAWRDKVFSLGRELGYEKTLLAIFPHRNTPVRVEHAFLHHSYSNAWLSKYDTEQMSAVDPTVVHCITKSVPLVWSPGIFSASKQREMYEEASSHGLKSGVTLPIHGVNGELGILCFVSDCSPGKTFNRHVISQLPELSCFRDFIFESSMKFMRPRLPTEEPLRLTDRELECLKWAAVGKSSWEIGQILNCTEATVNFHFGNIRRKFGSKSRQQAVAKAVCLGVVDPS